MEILSLEPDLSYPMHQEVVDFSRAFALLVNDGHMAIHLLVCISKEDWVLSFFKPWDTKNRFFCDVVWFSDVNDVDKRKNKNMWVKQFNGYFNKYFGNKMMPDKF